MTEMTEQRAREILGDAIAPDGGLSGKKPAFCWWRTDERAWTHGHFTADQLEAIAFWMRKHGD